MNKKNIRSILILLSAIMGTIVGFIIEYQFPNISNDVQILIKFPGSLLLRMLQLFIIPLIVSSLITAVTKSYSSSNNSLGMYVTVYYLCTTIIATCLGIVLVIFIDPGSYSTKYSINSLQVTNRPRPLINAVLDLLRNIIPLNIISMFTHHTQSRYATNIRKIQFNETLVKTNVTDELMLQDISGPNYLGITSCSLFFGYLIARNQEQCKPLIEFFKAIEILVMASLQVIVWYVPIGLFFLTAGRIIELEDMSAFVGLGMYVLTVSIGYIIHLFIIIPLAYFLITKKNPYYFIYQMIPAALIALATGSSSATLPVTIKCLETKVGISSKISRLILPIGATVNMDGTALYQSVACIFIAQLNGRLLNIVEIIIIGITATVTSIGASAIPGAGVITIVLVLSSIGLPTSDVTLIVSVDWFLDRLQTYLNIMGDSFGAAILEHMLGDKLIDDENDQTLDGTKLTDSPAEIKQP